MAPSALATLRRLRREEAQLKRLRATLQAEKARARRQAAVDASAEAERKHQQQSCGDEQASGPGDFRASKSGSNISALLPKNRSLEMSLAMFYTSGRDPRVQLDVTQRLLGSTVLSIAANAGPTGRWDPFDVKPQIFALGKYSALPVFTSLAMLRHFCWRNNLWTVRGPDGAVWAAQGAAPPETALLPAAAAAPEGKSARRRSGGAGNERDGEHEDSSPAAAEVAAARHHRRCLEAASEVEQFDTPEHTVAPLHIWGPPRAPCFYGYFGLLTTVFENASILPGEIDVILNPCSPIELALSHGLTSQHFARNAADTLVHSAFQRVEKRIRSEFISFLASGACPEVRGARSATLRKGFSSRDAMDARGIDAPPESDEGDDADRSGMRHRKRRRRGSRREGGSGGDDEMPADGDDLGQRLFESQLASGGGIQPELLQPTAFDIVVLLETRNYQRTALAIQRAKMAGLLVGHASLRVIPLDDAPPHVIEVAEPFYVKESASSSAGGGGLELAGEPVIANAHVSSDNFYANPALAYTEPHAMATKQSRRFY